MSENFEQKHLEALNFIREEVKSTAPRLDQLEKAHALLDSQEKANQKLVAEIYEKAAKIEEFEAKLNSMEAELRRPNLSANSSEFKEEVKSFKDFMRFGENQSERKYLRTDSNVEGGFLVPEALETEVIKKITEISNLRSVARVRTMGYKTLNMPVRTALVSVGMVGEGQEDSLSNSTYGQEKLVAKTGQVTVQATLQELADASVDVVMNINEDVAEAFAQLEGAQFINGSGIGNNCEGIMSNANIPSINSGSASAITFDSLIELIGELKTGYNPIYGFNRKTLAKIRTLKDTAGNYIWQAGNLGAGVPNTINGYNYIELPDMPNIGPNTYPVIFGDFRKGYTIGDRLGMSTIRDEFSKKREGKVEYTFYKRFAGLVTLPEAFVKLKIAA